MRYGDNCLEDCLDPGSRRSSSWIPARDTDRGLVSSSAIPKSGLRCVTAIRCTEQHWSNAFTPEAKGWEKAGIGIIALATIAPP